MLEPVKRRTRADREAEEMAERMQQAEERGKAGQEEFAAIKAQIVEGTRAYFNVVWPNGSTLIDVLDLVRATMLAVQQERGIKPEGWEERLIGMGKP